MKISTYLLIVFFTFSCQGQVNYDNKFKLSISPSVDLKDVEITKVVSVLSDFLKSKNKSLSRNEFWLQSDFDRYVYPYHDIYQIEKSKYGDNFFKPNLMEVVEISNHEKLLKIGFVGFNKDTNETVIRCIYNIIATKTMDDWKLKRALDFKTKDWSSQKESSITYYLPKNKTPNQEEIERQNVDIKEVCTFFEVEPIDIIYYSCDAPKQVFEIKGFDYLPNMYFGQTGGLTDYGNIIYSGNNSEYYTHEIIHIYTKKLFPKVQSILDEGIATYIGGSGLHDYNWHREKMKYYLKNTKIDLTQHLNPYERYYIDEETPIPYMIGALICERTFRIYGKVKLFEMLSSNNNLWDNLAKYGLTKENLTTELRKALVLPTIAFKQLNLGEDN